MISEKTLELNITHEILSLADHFNYLLRYAATIPWSPPLPDWYWLWEEVGWQKPSYATGLTLTDENRQGWDVRIEFPATSVSPSYALFLQFKAGRHKNYSLRPGSAFRGSRSSRRPHCQFGINNNSDRNQHILLRALASQPNLRGAVAYAFPRIPNAATFKAAQGHLIHLTSFVTVADLDNQATANGLSISSGTEHKFHTSYTNPFTQEMCSEPAGLENLSDSTGRIVAEIITSRVYRALVEAKQHRFPRLFTAYHDGWNNLLEVLQVQIANYLGVDSEMFSRITKQEPNDHTARILNAGVQGYKDFEQKFLQLAGIRDAHLRSPEARAEIFNQVVTQLRTYREFISKSDWYERPVPKPQVESVLNIHDGSLNLHFRESEAIPSEHALERVLKTISYQAF
jgi:hypothetical protein